VFGSTEIETLAVRNHADTENLVLSKDVIVRGDSGTDGIVSIYRNVVLLEESHTSGGSNVTIIASYNESIQASVQLTVFYPDSLVIKTTDNELNSLKSCPSQHQSAIVDVYANFSAGIYTYVYCFLCLNIHHWLDINSLMSLSRTLSTLRYIYIYTYAALVGNVRMLDVNATEVVSIYSTDLFISPSNLGFKMQANEQGTFVLRPTCGGGGSTCKYSPSLEVTVSGISRSVQAESLRKHPY